MSILFKIKDCSCVDTVYLIIIDTIEVITNFLIEIADITKFEDELITVIVFKNDIKIINMHILCPNGYNDRVVESLINIHKVSEPFIKTGLKMKTIACNKHQMISDMIDEISGNIYCMVGWDKRTICCTKFDRLSIYL